MHGRKKHVFVTTEQYRHDTNATLTALVEVLESTLKDMKANNEAMPTTLYLQLDSAPDNKSFLTSALLSALVEKQVFGPEGKIFCSYLPVGHTHEDVDQMFGVIARYLHRNVCDTIPQLLRACEASHSKAVVKLHAKEMNFVYDFTTLLDKYIIKDAMAGIRKINSIWYGQWGQSRRSDGARITVLNHPVVQYKVKMAQREWLPAGGLPIVYDFEEMDDFINLIPAKKLEISVLDKIINYVKARVFTDVELARMNVWRKKQVENGAETLKYWEVRPYILI